METDVIRWLDERRILNRTDVNAILLRFTHPLLSLSGNVDLTGVVQNLRSRCLISNEERERLMTELPEVNPNPRERMVEFSLKVITYTSLSFQQLEEVLIQFDDHLREFLLAGGGLLERMRRATLPNCQNRLKFYTYLNMKRHIDRGCMSLDRSDRVRFLKERVASYLRKTQEVDSIRERQVAFDLSVIYRCLLVQQCNKTEQKTEIVTDMFENTPQDIDYGFARAMFHCKMARIETSRTHVCKALGLTLSYNDPLLSALVSVDTLHVERDLHASNWNDATLDSAIERYAFGLTGLDNIFIQRLIFLNLAFCFLGINDSLDVNMSAIAPQNRDQARGLLRQVEDNFFDDIEPRRRMMYCLAKARAYDNETEEQTILDVVKNAEEAERLAVDNYFFSIEKKNIRAYLTYLRQKSPQTRLRSSV